ncbi:hypothetical protein DICSQDRAFT_171076 [Dichomitus squalens LYAD-421 SS1]|uniref:Uncharacterized protein n=1 Tax=Dichomitus squalens (strain LYAD-421) TaxID=732165 RepID=R7SWN0_DICSQ|nr:uncharacterized protein DICSQDRAFT_171076 [Dichomitus squalens LYAD-421 SS1]EJF60358.1 hypothetical protein DICSQDRAFT_171076 [Dichomitus squalens LYAD-421 SS1]
MADLGATPPTTIRFNQNVQRLDGTIEEFRVFHNAFKRNEKLTSQALLVLREENKGLHEQLKIVIERLAFVEAFCEIEEDGDIGAEEDGEGAEAVGENSGEPPSEPLPDSIAAGLESKELANMIPIKAVVNDTYELLLGVRNLAKKNIPGYPSNDEEWPTDPATGARYLRFNWALSATDPVNAAGIGQVKNTVRASGAARKFQCAPYLAKVQDTHLLGRITTKFEYIAREYRLYHKKPVQTHRTRHGGEDGVGDNNGFGCNNEDEEAPEGETETVQLERSVQRARAVAVAKQRKRKAQNTAWGDLKYDMAYLINAQSDHEDEYKEGNRPPGVPVRYQDSTSSMVIFTSTLSMVSEDSTSSLQQLYDEVNVQADPAPDQAQCCGD